MAYLILVRHGMSEWNAAGKWTGLTDVDLAPEGVAEAKYAAQAIVDIPIGVAFVSALKRSQQTLEHMKSVIGDNFGVIADAALNERNYGIYTGKNKWQVREEVGDEEFKQIRRGWNHPISEGETLEDVYKRVVPYYEKNILPHIADGKNVLICAHGNSLRALVKYLEGLTPEQTADLEIGVGEAYVYSMDERGKILSKEVRASNPQKGKI